MDFDCTILSIDEAFLAAGINPEFLPSVIRIPKEKEVALVLSEKEDCYYKVTKDSCGCDQFITGIHPCSHQISVWGIQKEFAREFFKEPEQKELLKNELERLKKEREKRIERLQGQIKQEQETQEKEFREEQEQKNEEEKEKLCEHQEREKLKFEKKRREQNEFGEYYLEQLRKQKKLTSEYYQEQLQNQKKVKLEPEERLRSLQEDPERLKIKQERQERIRRLQEELNQELIKEKNQVEDQIMAHIRDD